MMAALALQITNRSDNSLQFLAHLLLFGSDLTALGKSSAEVRHVVPAGVP